MSDTSLVFNLVARDRTEQGLSSARERFDSAAAGIGAGAGALLGVGIMEGLGNAQANSKLAAQLGLTEAESARIGHIAGSLYADAYGDSMETVNTAVGAVMSSIKGMSDASAADLEAASQAALNFASTFDIEVDRAVQTAGTLINSGLADNAAEAFDLLTAASNRVPAQLREDVLDAVDEYGQFFDTLGYDGPEAFALLVDASKKGMFGIDKAGDAVKEFTLLSTDMSTASQAAYKTIGLDAKEMANAILAGGDSAQGATQKIIDGLLAIKDPATQANTAIALFGTPLEDMNVRDIPAFLTSLKGASGSMDGFSGAAKRSGEALRDNATTPLEQFKRKAMSTVASVGGKFAQFALDNQEVFVPLAYTLMGLASTVLVVKGAMITYSAVSSVVAGAHAIMTASAWGVIGTWLRMNGIGLMVYARIAGAAVVSGATTAAAWTGSALAAIGTWILSVVRAAVVSSVQFVIMAAKATWWAATMAAQWLIAMGPVGWVIAVIVGLVALIIANWDTVKRWTGIAWGWISRRIADSVASVLAVVGWLARIPGWVAGWFQSARDWAVRKALSMVSWLRGLPGRILTAIGSLNSLLVQKGKDVVSGLWSGISAMGGWLKSQLISFAKSAIPGPIAKALGIASPSKVTAAQGKWIARGLVVGLTGSRKQVMAAAAKMADIIRDALAPGKKRTKALAKLDFGTERLLRLASREAIVASRLKAATKRLDDLVKARAALVADVKKGIIDSADITQLGGDGPVSAETLLTKMTDKLAAAKKFTADLETLSKKGVRSDLIAEIAQAGVEGGAGAAAALANADKGTLAQINSTQAQIVKAGTVAGTVAGDALYGAGIHAAKGLVQGLKAEHKAIENAMLSIALGMQKALKKALGIKSPSTVLADEVGRWIPPGVVAGMKRTAPQLDDAMRNLVRPELAAPARPLATPGMAPLMGAQAGGGLVRVRLDFTGADGDMKRMLRKMVRVDGRGTVQVAFGN
jgi:hypothetical protein